MKFYWNTAPGACGGFGATAVELRPCGRDCVLGLRSLKCLLSCPLPKKFADGKGGRVENRADEVPRSHGAGVLVEGHKLIPLQSVR